MLEFFIAALVIGIAPGPPSKFQDVGLALADPLHSKFR